MMDRVRGRQTGSGEAAKALQCLTVAQTPSLQNGQCVIVVVHLFQLEQGAGKRVQRIWNDSITQQHSKPPVLWPLVKGPNINENTSFTLGKSKNGKNRN